ncbi:MAG: 1-(5-phosphoribosyl)-5-[(5-phosphoribosylamino)methylideneamino]imidazole-4-carboxamide isomerase [Candidatus Omnitrophica bacterium]|nr:1-(5-phosphoribosyl)-5-[(5-phosphoribosylamino)methylideneamino]imidazole-4-carboxamide isomerase [Candidatus Omnitrophota bacterium]
MIILPAIDIIDGKTVRLVKGNYDNKLSYDLSPLEAAREWKDSGAGMLHIIDLDGAKKGEPVNLNVASEIVKELDISIEIGGGYRNFDQVDMALSLGVTRVILGSSAVKDLDFARRAIKNYGEKIIISVDVLDGEIKVHGWEAGSEYDLDYYLNKIKEYGAKRIIFTDVSKDGTLEGPDINYLKNLLSGSAKGLKMVYAGGIKNLQNINALIDIEEFGIEGIVTGRAIYDGTLDLKEAIDAC